MKLERNLTATNNEETLRDRIAAYFTASGFHAITGGAPLVYRRGSKWGSLSSVMPEAWLATATLSLQPGADQSTTVLLTLQVDTALQWVTEKQRAFWLRELQDLETTIQNGASDRSGTEQARQAAVSETVKANLAVLLLALVAGALFYGAFQRAAAIFPGLAIGLFMGITAAGRLLKFQPEDQLVAPAQPGLAQTEVQSLSRGEIRTWGAAAVLLGFVHLFAAGPLNAPWGIALILVGLASFYLSIPAMAIVYSLSLVWLAVTNALTGDILWVVFALFQLILAWMVFRRFQHFHPASLAPVAAEIEPGTVIPEPGSQAFTLAGLVLGAVSLVGFIAVFMVVLAGLHAGTLDQGGPVLAFFEGLSVSLGVLGFAAGLASLLSHFPRRPLAIISMASGGLVMLLELALTLLHI